MIVLGGGPAGAISAWLAARDGLRVLLVDPQLRSGRLEGLSPRLHQWLQTSGLGDGGSAMGPFPRRVDWGSQTSGANGEYLLDRDRLNSHLQTAAQIAGAQIEATTGSLTGRNVTLSDGRSFSAPWILDARGRRSHRAARHSAGFATISVCGWYRTARDMDPGCAISVTPEGWVWRATLPDGRAWAQFTCDARSRHSLSERLLAALRRVLPKTGDIRLVTQPMGMAATPVLPAPVKDLSCLAVGDALSAMDPLSGHGVFWAVSSALAAAATRRTLVARPGAETEALCRRYLEERAMATYMRNARVGRDFIRLEERYSEQTFWSDRADFPDETPSHETVLRPEVRKGIVVRAGLVEEMEMLHTPDHPEGVGWYGPVQAAGLWRRIRAGAPRAAVTAEHGPGIASIYDQLRPFAAKASA
ncbi:pilus assembly protein CpaD [Marinovum sp.]|uniref:flavin-dependent monooxygenase QhpG n=1 Tax=Marinovum sp. TaxID=2024839 RepID=UPI002B2766E9|nr:pilus assembly protein CpaD [Marinovum sp.]